MSITVFKPHSCSPAIHYNNLKSHSVKYLIEHHRAAIIDNRKITAAQIRSNERHQYSNNINYLQAYRTIQAVLEEMYGEEAESFKKFPAYAERFEAADSENFYKLAFHEATSYFQAAFFAPASLRHAQLKLRPFIGIDGTHTGSRFRMTLLIADGIDSNDEVLILAWALVPIECEAWWEWFLKYLKRAFLNIQRRSFIFMSDREKGLPNALKATLPAAYQAYCCQHLADNVQQRFSKCRPLFWKCARAKKLDDFKDALQALMDQDVDAGNYINSIPHTSWARYCFPVPRFGHDTNNIIESINSLLDDIRKLPPLQMMDAIYSLCMTTVYDRFH